MNVGNHGKSASVFVAIFNERREVLLVKNKEKWNPEREFMKPEGWGLPGGGVDKDEKRDPERWMKNLSTAMLELYLEVFTPREEETEKSMRDHAAWREVYEETGFFIDPRTIEDVDVRSEKRGDNHVVYLVRAKIIGGSLKTTPGEDTLMARWVRLPVVELMEGVYEGHRARIRRAAEFLPKEPDEAEAET